MRFQVLMTPTPGTTVADFEPYVAREARKSWEYVKAGSLREMLYTEGSLLPVHSRWECADRAELDQLIAGFPMIHDGLLQAQVFALTTYNALEELFAPAVSDAPQ